MNFFTLLFLSFTVLVVSSEKVEREKNVFDSTSEGTAVTPKYAKMGYVLEHKATCQLTIYQTAPNEAAGDKDMRMASRIILKQFNKAFKKSTADGGERNVKVDNVLPPLAVKVEILSQRVGQKKKDRRLAYNGGSSYDWSKVVFVLGWASDLSSPDNSDGRRLANNALAESDLVEKVAMDLLKSGSEFFAPAVENFNCLEMSCNGFAFQRTAGCSALFGDEQR